MESVVSNAVIWICGSFLLLYTLVKVPTCACLWSCASVSLVMGNNKNHAQLVVQYTSTVAHIMHTSKGCKYI